MGNVRKNIFFKAILFIVLILLAVLPVRGGDPDSTFAEPIDGWSYVYNSDLGQDTLGTMNNFDSLDGSWDHENGSDVWTDPAKIVSDGDILTITDNLTTENDRKFYLAHNLANESTPDTFIDDGVTLHFRARGNYALHNGGKGNIGIRQQGPQEAMVSVAFYASANQLLITDGSNMDDSTVLYSLDVSQWHDYWLTIEADSSVGGKTHKVVLWIDGQTTPKATVWIEASVENESDYSNINYLTIGCGSSAQTGYMELDYLAYKLGANEPNLNTPPTADAGSDQTIFWPYQRRIQLHGSADDDDPCDFGVLGIDYGGVQWYQLSGTAVTYEPNDTVFDPLVTVPSVGVYDLQLRVWDDLAQEANDIVTISVYPSLLGDLNLDYAVDLNDLAFFISQWLDPPGCTDYLTGCADLDLYGNNINLSDFASIAQNWLTAWPTVTIVATDANAAEQDSNLGLFTVTRTSASGDLTVYYDIGGTAESDDYTGPLTGQITILDGQQSQTITIIPDDDSESEGSETVLLTITAASGYQVGEPNNAAVTIADNDFSGLDSPKLRLEVDLDPYAYRLIEKSTMQLLLEQSMTQLTIGGSSRTVLNVTDVNIVGSQLSANLVLDGTLGSAQVEFTLVESDLLKVVYSCSGDTPSNIKEEYNDHGEHYYGIWEYPQGANIDNRGADRDLIGFGGMPGTNFANARAPFYVTTRKYGIYVDTVALGHYSVARGGKTSFDFDEEALTYYVIYGPDYENIFNHYNDLAGPAWMPPDWAFDSVWWRDDDHSDHGHYDLVEQRTIDSAEDNVEATANHLQYYRIPASAIWIDRPYTSGSWGWGNMDFNPVSDWFPSGTPNGQAMIDYLENKGYHLLLWVANRCYNTLKSEGLAYGYLFEGYTDSPAADMRDPDAYDWFENHLDTFVSMGIRGYKIDRGHEGEMPDSVENENVYLFNKMAAEGQMAQHGADYLIHARNAYDKSRKYIGIWNGDTSSDFSGLSVSIKNGLRCGAINFPYYGSDIGGYISDNPPEELFARWLGFGAYSTMMEILIDPDRTVWYEQDFDPNNEPNLVEIARIHCSDHHDLIPYTKSCMYLAHQDGIAVMRQLIFAYPSDSLLYDKWDEYLYGPEILVAPITNDSDNTARSRSVYLPNDKWLNYNDKSTIYQGPTTIVASAPLEVIPLFVRAGAVIPRGDILQSNNNWTPSWSPSLRIECFPDDNTSNTFNYYTGSCVVAINCTMNGAGLLNINFDALDYGGDLEIYLDLYSTVTKNSVPLSEGVDFTYDSGSNLMTIPFSGATTIEITGAQSIF